MLWKVRPTMTRSLLCPGFRAGRLRDLYKLSTAALIALGCNEVLGLEPGTLQPSGGEGDGGAAGSVGEGGSALVPSNGGSTNGGSAGSSGGATPPQGGAAGSNAGVGGSKAGIGGGAGRDDGGAGAGGDDSCASTAECIAQGLAWPPYMCLSGACVDILTEECNTVIGAEWVEDHPEDQPFIFGCYLRGPGEIEAYPAYWNVKLAMQEFTEHGAIPIDGDERRPVMLLCKPPFGSDLTPLYRSFDHLIDRVGVPAVAMLASRPELRQSVEYVLLAKQADVFFVDSDGANYDLLLTPDAQRLWHMMGDIDMIHQPFAPLVERVEEHVNRGAAMGQAARRTRLVLVATGHDDAFESHIAKGLEFALRINGAPVTQQPNEYRKIDSFLSLDELAAEVAAFEPDIVVDFGFTSLLESLIDTAARSRGASPPFYVLPPSRARTSDLRERVVADESLRTRVVGLNYAAAEDTTLYDALVERLQTVSPDGFDASGIENTYDAVYFLLYAAIAGGAGGTKMAAGMQRLLAGPRRDIGPEKIASVVDRLTANPDNILSFYGTLGPPDFHRPTGGRFAYANAWCLNEDLSYAMDVLRYDPLTQQLSGTFPCFGF